MKAKFQPYEIRWPSCPVCGQSRTLRHRGMTEEYYSCPPCKLDFRIAAEIRPTEKD